MLNACEGDAPFGFLWKTSINYARQKPCNAIETDFFAVSVVLWVLRLGIEKSLDLGLSLKSPRRGALKTQNPFSSRAIVLLLDCSRFFTRSWSAIDANMFSINFEPASCP